MYDDTPFMCLTSETQSCDVLSSGLNIPFIVFERKTKARRSILIDMQVAAQVLDRNLGCISHTSSRRTLCIQTTQKETVI